MAAGPNPGSGSGNRLQSHHRGRGHPRGRLRGHRRDHRRGRPPRWRAVRTTGGCPDHKAQASGDSSGGRQHHNHNFLNDFREIMFVLFCCLKSLKYILFHMNINHVRLPVLLGSVLGRGQNQRIRGRNRYLLRPPGGRWRSREEKGERDRGHLVNAVADRGQGKAQGPSTSQIYQLGEVFLNCSVA